MFEKKTPRNRYILTNLVNLGYVIGISIIDFNSSVNESWTDNSENICDNTTTVGSSLDQSVKNVPLVTRLYIIVK